MRFSHVLLLCEFSQKPHSSLLLLSMFYYLTLSCKCQLLPQWLLFHNSYMLPVVKRKIAVPFLIKLTSQKPHQARATEPHSHFTAAANIHCERQVLQSGSSLIHPRMFLVQEYNPLCVCVCVSVCASERVCLFVLSFPISHISCLWFHRQQGPSHES